MKKALTLFLCLLAFTGFSQSINGIVTSAGNSFTVNGITITSAVGKSLIMSTTNSSILFDNTEISTSIGIYESENELKLTFYPNPTSDFIQTNETNIDVLSVYSISGALIKEEFNTSIIDIQNIHSGVYILIAKSNQIISTFKFIKK